MNTLVRAVCDDCDADLGRWVSGTKVLVVLRKHKQRSGCPTPVELDKGWRATCPCGWKFNGSTYKITKGKLHKHLANDGCIDNAIDAEVKKNA